MDTKLKNITDVPYTISFVIRKRMQIDSFNELTEDKRPPDEMIYEGSGEELDNWIKNVVTGKSQATLELDFSEDEIE